MTADRAESIVALRALANLLEQHDEVPIPLNFKSRYSPINFPVGYGLDDTDEDTKARVVEIARTLIAGKWEKTYDEESTGCLRIYGQTADGLWVQIYAPRDKVCRKVVTTSEVTETVPDPSVEVPTVTITRVVENVEWVCEPLLAAEPVGASS